MDKKQRQWLTKEIGLEAGYRFSKFVLKSEHLHFGLFESDIPVDVANLKAAQERYVQRLAELIPPGTRSILDVGCGAGKTAEYLIGNGFAVDCVSPGAGLADIAAERLGDRAMIYRGPFEDVSIAKRYDLVLFSESFQYLEPGPALVKAASVLEPRGHVLICDYFSRAKGEGPLGGGHDLAVWGDIHRDSSFELVNEGDITAGTAPTMDLMDAFTREVSAPLWANAKNAAQVRWPVLSRLARWLLRKPIDGLERRGLASGRDGAAFRRFKVYKTYLFRLRENATAWA